MIILNKKRIIFFISILMISFASITISEKNMPQTVETSSTPVSGHTLILDAGHGQPDGGASSNTGVTEEEINLKIVLKLQELLEQSGTTVILTRSDENGIYDLDKKTIRNKKVSDMKNRVEIGNNSEAEAFISIHLNKIPQTQYYGWQSFFQKDNKKSQQLALNIQNNLNYAIQKQNKREISELSGKYIMDHVKIPTVTVECGFLSNVQEANDLQNDEYQDKIAWGIYSGIMDYFNSDSI